MQGGIPNWIVPTPPAGDSSHRVADTEFVTNAIASSATGITTTVLASALATTLASAYAGTTGFVLQTVYSELTGLVVSTLTMQGNFSSVPVKSDGREIVTATITPFATANKLLIRAVVPVGNQGAANMYAALFQDTVTAALAQVVFGNGANLVSDVSMVYSTTAGTTGATTFKVNVMNLSTVVSTWVVNGLPSGLVTVAASRATLVIQETKG